MHYTLPQFIYIIYVKKHEKEDGDKKKKEKKIDGWKEKKKKKKKKKMHALIGLFLPYLMITRNFYWKENVLLSVVPYKHLHQSYLYIYIYTYIHFFPPLTL